MLSQENLPRPGQAVRNGAWGANAELQTRRDLEKQLGEALMHTRELQKRLETMDAPVLMVEMISSADTQNTLKLYSLSAHLSLATIHKSEQSFSFSHCRDEFHVILLVLPLVARQG